MMATRTTTTAVMRAACVVAALAAAATAAAVLEAGVGSEFRWESCAGAEPADVHVERLLVAPSPVVFGRNASVTADFKIAKTLTRVPLALTIEKQVAGFWVKVPCQNNVGSCTYEDFCTELSQIPEDQCPELLRVLGLGCRCPFAEGLYTTNGPQPVEVPTASPTTEKLVAGNLRVTVRAHDQDGSLAACITVWISVATQ
eukprot:m51a1_g6849 putative ganglioside gm2 activator (200) ;mRNA; r:94451-95391